MLTKGQLSELYYIKKFSMFDISRHLLVTPATVLYWMKKHSLKRRSNSESAYVKQNPNGDPFEIKSNLTNKEKELFLLGLMLYWAEGSRKNKHVIQIANLDNRLLRLFVKFLKEICGVTKEKISLTVQLHKSFDKERTKKFWSEALGIQPRFISVNIHPDKRSKPTLQWSEFGIARIEVRNVKLKRWIDQALENYLKNWV